jgi:SAM-dependent methyltransferase
LNLPVDELERLISKFAAGECLDIGGGDGQWARFLREAGRKIVVLEPSAAMATSARDSDGSVDVVRGDGRKLPFKSGVFGTSILIALLHHVDDPERVLREAERVSTRSIIFDYVASERRLLAFAERLWLRYQDGGGILHFGEEGWRHLISRLGGSFRELIISKEVPFFMAAVIDWEIPSPGRLADED